MAGRHLHAVRPSSAPPVERTAEDELADLFAIDAALQREAAANRRAIDHQRERFRKAHQLLMLPSVHALKRQFGPK